MISCRPARRTGSCGRFLPAARPAGPARRRPGWLCCGPRSAGGRRGHARPEEEPQPQANEEPKTTAGWWREFEADLQAVERALARQHQAAIDAGEPWPPQRAPELNAGPTPKASPKASPEDEPAPEQPAQQNRTARIDELLARAGKAAQRLAVQQAEQQASSEYAARIEREAQAEPEAGHQAEAGGQAEIKM